MEFRGQEAKEEVLKLGGVETITKKLKSHSSNGLDSNDQSDIEQRKTTYGRNYIEPKKPPTFWELCWEALKDPTLIILIFAALFSVLLPLISSALSSESISPKYCIPDAVESGHHCAVCEYLDGAAILLAVVMVVFITAYNDYKKEQKFRGLQEKVEGNQVFTVIRSGLSIEIPIAEIVVGDICQVKYGDSIPADGILLQSNDLKIDESSLTGESDHVKKGVDRDPCLLSGTYVMEGSGKMIITAVGVNSQSGKIFSLLQGETNIGSEPAKTGDGKVAPMDAEAPAASPSKLSNSQQDCEEHNKSVLKAKLNKLAEQIGKIALFCAVVTMIILYIRLMYNVFSDWGQNKIQTIQKDQFEKCFNGSWIGQDEQGNNTCTALKSVANPSEEVITLSTFNDTWMDSKKDELKELCLSSKLQASIRYFIIGVTILVVAVPEGLPLAVTIALAYSVSKMLLDNNLVRHLDACETMGNATTICSDKTGTLTTNRMTVVKSHISGKTFETTPANPESDIKSDIMDMLVTGISVNSSYTSKVVDGNQVGNKTECALLGFVKALGRDYDSIRKINPESDFFKVYTFNSARKSMSTVLKSDSGYRMFTKGASEIILGKCSKRMTDNGPVDFTEAQKNDMVEDVIEQFAKEGLRTIGIAYKDLPADGNDWEDEDKMIADLTLIAIVGIEDPVRDEVPDAIRKCKKAGITVRMVTGDNINTARSIARKCGILSDDDPHDLVIEGREFNARIRDQDGVIRQKLIDQIWPKLRVLARSSPTDKHTLVNGIINSRLTDSREVVAVTGDGTNDGPALKIADVGFAMGIAGTDVAREASDIILTDDNFTSIVRAVVWGRNVYDSISKFLTFQLTVNVVAVCVSCIGAVVGGESPFTAIQLLWVNLIMDTFAALALATELPTDALLDRKPYGRTKPLITQRMARTVLLHALYQLVIIFTLLYKPEKFIPDLKFDSEELVKEGGVNDKNTVKHLGILFTTFVFMQIFNEINSRKINDERNVFERFFSNVIFISVIIGTSITQLLLVWTPVNIAFGIDENGHTFKQWVMAILLGLGQMIWHQLVISIPSSIIPSFMTVGGGNPEEIGEDVVANTQRRTTMMLITGNSSN